MWCVWRICAASAASNCRRSISRNRGSPSASAPTFSGRGIRRWRIRTRSPGCVKGLPQYEPSEVERTTGVAAARVERLARDLAQSEPAVAIVGGAPLAHTNGLFHALAINALNALLDAVERPGGLSFTPRVEP